MAAPCSPPQDSASHRNRFTQKADCTHGQSTEALGTFTRAFWGRRAGRVTILTWLHLEWRRWECHFGTVTVSCFCDVEQADKRVIKEQWKKYGLPLWCSRFPFWKERSPRAAAAPAAGDPARPCGVSASRKSAAGLPGLVTNTWPWAPGPRRPAGRGHPTPTLVKNTHRWWKVRRLRCRFGRLLYAQARKIEEGLGKRQVVVRPSPRSRRAVGERCAEAPLLHARLYSFDWHFRISRIYF